MIFFTSDNHYGHSNIIKFANRPFSSCDEMDKVMIERWNEVVGPDDSIYHLGDFSFRNPLLYLEKLNGIKYLIRGNHDKRVDRTHIGDRKHNFRFIRDLYTLRYKGHSITLSHFSMRVWPRSHFNSYHLYGHSHNTLAPMGKSFDIGVDANDFRPVSIDEVIFRMKLRPDNPGYIHG